jgi:hypothetical protein
MKASRVALVLNEDSQKSPEASVANDERWQLVQKIVASKSFVKSSFLTNFLLYVSDREIRGRADEISEYQIGIHAFGRPASYNPGDDNVVRNYARLLRKRLEEYFETEGKLEALRIRIPVGQYIPVFCPSVSSEEPSETKVLSSATEYHADLESRITTSGARRRPAAVVLYVSLLLVLFIGVLSAIYFGITHLNSAFRSPSHRLWAQVFGHNRQTIIVPADSGFGILQNLTGNVMNLGDYVNGAYLSRTNEAPGVDGRNLNDLRTQRYTSEVDLNITLSFSRLPEVVSDKFAVRYARDLSLEDLKHSNAILLGSVHTNPWVELFQKDLNFVLEYQSEVDDSVVINRHPLSGENSIYKNAWDDDSHETYTVIAFVPSLDGMGNVILLQGLNMGGTQAAADFLLNERTIDPFLKKATRVDGTLQPFELLLETNSIGANAPEARVIAERYGLEKLRLNVENRPMSRSSQRLPIWKSKYSY